MEAFDVDKAFNIFRDELRQFEMDVFKVANKLGKTPERTEAFKKAGKILHAEMQRRAPIYKKVVKRYSNGKVVAVYHPGNLKRSVQILEFNKSDSVFVGIKRDTVAKARGVYSGSRADGYYAHMVEYGRRKNPFIRPAVDAVGGRVVKELERFVEKQLNARS